MKIKLKKLILPLLMMLLTTSKIYSQKTILLNNDSLIAFSIPQAKYLLDVYYEKEYFQMLDSLCEQQRAVCDSLNLSKDKIIDNQKQIIQNKIEVVTTKDYEMQGLKQMIEEEKRKTRVQKTYKVIAIIAGSAATTYLGFKYITK